MVSYKINKIVIIIQNIKYHPHIIRSIILFKEIHLGQIIIFQMSENQKKKKKKNGSPREAIIIVINEIQIITISINMR